MTYCDCFNCLSDQGEPMTNKRTNETKTYIELINTVNQLEGDELKVMLKLAQKMLAGKMKYGEWTASNDKRNYRKEASEEIFDALNYMCMQLIKEQQ